MRLGYDMGGWAFDSCIEVYISHFNDLIGLELIINEDVLNERQELCNVVRCTKNTNICQELDVDFDEVVAKVFLYLPNGKCPG